MIGKGDYLVAFSLADQVSFQFGNPMKLTPTARKLIKRIFKILLVVEVVYLVVINSILLLPFTQTAINKIRPEKFQIAWDHAWSLYPFRVHVRGGSANGNSRSQIWEFEADAVSGSISLLPLIFKRVWVRNITVSNIDYRQRPRLRPDKDFSRIESYFPVIEGREVTSAVTTPKKKKRSWHISINDIHVSGNHSYWINQFRGSTRGEINADLSYTSRGGPLALDVNELNLDLDRHFINGDQELFRRGAIEGSLGFRPFMPRQHKGVKMLDYLLMDVVVDFDVNKLSFINLLTLDYSGLKVEGAGKVKGRLNFDEGYIRQGTDLAVDARDLLVSILDHDIRGSGSVDLAMGPDTGGLMKLNFNYRDLEVIHAGDETPFLTGRKLVLNLSGDGKLVPDPDRVNESRTLAVEIDKLTAPDLALFQRYIPEKWPFILHGGEGRLEGQFRLASRSFSADMRLTSESADMGIQQYRFDTNLDTALKLDNADVIAGGTTISGTYIRLSDARLQKEGDERSEPWEASLVFNEGYFSLMGEAVKQNQKDFVDLIKLLEQSRASNLLGNSGAAVQFDADVSSLAWIGVLFGSKAQTEVSGSSNIKGELHMAEGLPMPGTRLDITSEDLAVHFLEYVSRGDGRIALRVEEGGEFPDWLMSIDLENGDMRRRGEDAAYIKDVILSLKARIEDVSFEQKEDRKFALEFKIPSARVTDMSVFNANFPADSPIRFTGGEASLGADIVLLNDDADGWVRLKSSDVKAAIDDQSIRADLQVDILLVDGVPADMMFDISGSRVVLDHVKVEGEKQEFEQDNWSAVVELPRGETTWKEPTQLKLEIDLSMSDSRPIVAMFSNQGWRPKFLTDMMTVEDIKGKANINMADGRIVIPLAKASGDTMEVDARAVITEQSSNGMVYFRYKKFDALLKIKDGKKNLDIIKPLEKYQAYTVE